MPDTEAPDDADGVARGQRVRREMEVDTAHDGKERTRSAKPKRSGQLPADMTNAAPAEPSVEDVVELEPGPSSWEAKADEEERSHPPPARGIGR
jgi:hypothetical protein